MIKKMLLLAVSAAALIAFAVPTAASAAVFTHEGEVIEEALETELTGTTGLVVLGVGVHCKTIHVRLKLFPLPPQVKEFKPTECIFSTGLPVHPTAGNLPWTLEALPGNKAEITGVNLHTSIRHPQNTNLEVATNVLSGNVLLTLGEGGSATLSNGSGGLFVNGTVPATISGSLTNGGTGIGTE